MTHLQGPFSLTPMPLDDSMVEAGSPVGEGTVLYSSPDGRTTVGMFRCTPGRFRHTVDSDEVTHLLAGNIVIQPDDGDIIDANAGDTFILRAGQSMLIDVRETITDIYVTWMPE